MRVLVGCEFSGTVRDAFADRGHNAWSCDLLPTEKAGRHYAGDVLHLLDGWMPVKFMGGADDWCEDCDADMSECFCLGPTQDGIEYTEIDGVLFGRPEDAPHWDLAVFHPPCTYLASSGLHWEKRIPGRADLGRAAVEFVRKLMDAPIPRIALENPIGRLSSTIRKPDQIVQPWHFGDDASKATCLWLKGLPLLRDTNRLDGDARTRRANQTPGGQNRLGPSADRWKLRSMTYPGIAAAMAAQWGDPDVGQTRLANI